MGQLEKGNCPGASDIQWSSWVLSLPAVLAVLLLYKLVHVLLLSLLQNKPWITTKTVRLSWVRPRTKWTPSARRFWVWRMRRTSRSADLGSSNGVSGVLCFPLRSPQNTQWQYYCAPEAACAFLWAGTQHDLVHLVHPLSQVIQVTVWVQTHPCWTYSLWILEEFWLFVLLFLLLQLIWYFPSGVNLEIWFSIWHLRMQSPCSWWPYSDVLINQSNFQFASSRVVLLKGRERWEV